MSVLNFFHKTLSAGLILGSAVFADVCSTPAQASKLVALVLGTSAPGADIQPRLKGLEESLFALGGGEIKDARIFAGHNLTREDLLARLSAFESNSSEDGDVVTVVAYIGPVAHSEKGTTYIVPTDWNGEDERGLVALHNTLQMLKTKGRNYVMLDALPTSDGMVWKTKAVKPGLGKLTSYGASDRLAIAYAEVPVSALARSPLLEALTKQLSLERIKLGELPELVHMEAQFDIGRSAVLRKVGTLGGTTELVRLKGSEMDQRKERCHIARAEASNKAAATIVSGVSGDGEPLSRASGGDLQASRRDFMEWFCPESPTHTARLHKPAQAQQGQHAKSPGRVPEAGNPSAAPRGNQGNAPRSAPTGGGNRSWAGTAVPIPN